MRLKAIWILCALALGGLALATAGCGGGGSSTTAAEETATTETVDTATTATETTATETTATEMTTTETTDMTATETTGTETTGTETSAAPDLSFLTSEKCQEYVQFVSSFGAAMSGTGGTDIEKAAQAMQDSADQAPEEIRADFQTFAEFYVKLAAAYEGVDMSSGQLSPELLARLQKLSSEIDMAKVTAASTNISTWLTENCTGVTGG